MIRIKPSLSLSFVIYICHVAFHFTIQILCRLIVAIAVPVSGRTVAAIVIVVIVSITAATAIAEASATTMTVFYIVIRIMLSCFLILFNNLLSAAFALFSFLDFNTHCLSYSFKIRVSTGTL